MDARRLFAHAPLLFLLAVTLTAGAARAQDADDFAKDNLDYSTSPPTVGAGLQAILDFAGPLRDYYREGGQPFAPPAPPLPAGVDKVWIKTRIGCDYESVGTGYCFTSWKSRAVILWFTDGSIFTYEFWSKKTNCSNGSSDSFEYTTDTAEWGNYEVNVRSWKQDALATVKKVSLRASAGATLAPTAPPGTPLIAPGTDVLEISVGPGGVLDLTGHPAAAGPIFVTTGPALVRCDTVLMDPGVLLPDLFAPAPTLLPAAEVRDPALLPGAVIALPSSGPSFMPVRIRNRGNAPDQVSLSWADQAGWAPPGQTTVALALGDTQDVQVPIVVPAGTPHGVSSLLTLQVTSMLDPSVSETREILLDSDHPGIVQFGTGTPGCQGVHGITANEAPVLGSASFQVSLSGAVPGLPGALMIALNRDLAGSDPFLSMTAFHVSPLDPTFFFIPFQGDASGSAHLPLPLPLAPGLVGLEVNLQAVWIWPVPCLALPLGLSTSRGLLTILHLGS